MRNCLLATITQQKFLDLPKTAAVEGAVRDIMDSVFWKAIYMLCRACYPLVRALGYCDKNEPAMDKIYFLTHRASEALVKSVDIFNDPQLFGVFDKVDESCKAEDMIWFPPPKSKKQEVETEMTVEDEEDGDYVE